MDVGMNMNLLCAVVPLLPDKKMENEMGMGHDKMELARAPYRTVSCPYPAVPHRTTLGRFTPNCHPVSLCPGMAVLEGTSMLLLPSKYGQERQRGVGDT